MTTEQLLLNEWRHLPDDMQQQVIEFVEFLRIRSDTAQILSDQPGEQVILRRRTAPPELKGSVEILGDIISPIVDEEDWECLKEDWEIAS